MSHADDETLGAGGTMVHLKNNGWDVRVVMLTDGEISTRGSSIMDNRTAAYVACETLGVAEPIILGFADQKFDNYPFAACENELKEYPHAFSLEVIELVAKYHGFHAGYPMAEAFHMIRGYPGLLP